MITQATSLKLYDTKTLVFIKVIENLCSNKIKCWDTDKFASQLQTVTETIFTWFGQLLQYLLVQITSQEFILH